jgi:hypothetical protein
VTGEHDTLIRELWCWFTDRVDRQYGEVGFIVTKHDGHICKVEKIDRQHIAK